MSEIKLKYFGTDGVRGIANDTLTPELAFRLGRAGGAILTRHAQDDKKPVVIVGRDTRISGEMLQQAIIAGFLSVGIDVLRLGVITTPAVAFLVQNLEADAGVQITVSHNPASDNGIKFFGNDGFKLSDELKFEIEQLLDSPVDDLPRPSAAGLGVVNNYPEGALKYLSFLQKTIPTDLEGMRIALDGANGATSGLLAHLFADLNADFVMMGTEPNGLNINDGVGSTHPEALAAFVTENDVQVGLAFDGDGDRLIAVDENGEIVDGDKIMYITGKFMDAQGRLKHHTVVSTVMSNIGFYKALSEHGMTSVKTAVGDRYVMAEMLASGYNLGGEQSGHIIFLDYNPTGDGILTSLMLIRSMVKYNKKASELASIIDIYPQVLVNAKVALDKKYLYKEDSEITKMIQEVEEKLKNDGRVLIRPSGTEPLVRVMLEGKNIDKITQYANDIAQIIEKKSNL